MPIILNSELCGSTHIISKNRINHKFLSFNIIFLISLFPPFSPNIIKIKLFLEQEGDFVIFNFKDNRPCPSQLFENGFELDDRDKCKPYLSAGNHTIDLIFSNTFSDCTAMFESRTGLIEIDLSNFDASNVNYMAYMFKNCSSLEKVIMPSINGDKLEQMKNMFVYCKNLISVEFQKNFVTKNVINMQKMFGGCINLKSVNFPDDFETSKVSNINDMFSGCSSLSSINFNIFKISQPNNMASLFQNTKFVSYNLSNFDISKVTDMEYMFYNCTELISLDLSSFDYSSLEKMDYMMSNNNNLRFVNFGEKEIKESVSSYNVFENSNKKMIIYVNKKNPEDLFNGTDFIFAIVECGNILPNDILSIYQENKIVCIPNCRNLNKFKYNYMNQCYINCPPDTITNRTSFICEKNETIPLEIQESTMSNIENILTKTSEIIPLEIQESSNPKLNFQTTNISTSLIKNNHIIIPIQIETPKIIETENLKINITIICDIKQFFLEECKNKFQNEEQKEIFSQNILNEILDGNMNEILSAVIKEDKIFLIEDNNEKYQISTISKQTGLDNLTTIDFGECEDILKQNYSLNKSEELLIFKIEHTIEGINIPIIEYALFNNNGSILLDLTLCDQLRIGYNTPVKIDTKEIHKYNISSEYYSDLCKQYSFDKIDLTLYERKNEFNEKNMSLCEYGCIYGGYNISTSKVECKCSPKNFFAYLNRTRNENNLQILNTVYAEKKNYNLDVTQCINLFTSKDEIKSNPSFYILLLIIILLFIIGIFFCCKSYRELNYKMNNVIEKIFSDKKIILKKNKKKIKNPPKKLKMKRKNNNNNRNNKFLNRKIENRNKKKNIKSSSINTMNENNMNINNIYDNDYELNILSYSEALKYDKRKKSEYYCSLICYKQIILYSILNSVNYTPGIIKKFIIFLAFALHYGINAIFFNDNIMHKIYEDQGSYDILYQLPFACYSALICTLILRIMLETLIITEKNFLDVKIQKNKVLAVMQKGKSMKCIMIKYIIFFILCAILLTFFWIYLTCFSALYKNTQIHLIKNTFISFGISSVYPFVINVIPTILRYDAFNSVSKEENIKLKGNKKNADEVMLKEREYIYKVSKYFQIL